MAKTSPMLFTWWEAYIRPLACEFDFHLVLAATLQRIVPPLVIACGLVLPYPFYALLHIPINLHPKAGGAEIFGIHGSQLSRKVEQ